MTKIPSVEERVKRLELCECETLSGESQTDRITQALTADRTTLLTELRETSCERQKGWLGKEEDGSDRHPNYDEHDWLQARLDELIKANSL